MAGFWTHRFPRLVMRALNNIAIDARTWLLAGAALLAAGQAGAGPDIDIDVVGLFKDAAMVEIDGRSLLLKVGEQSAEGVLLISADSDVAVIHYAGAEYVRELSQKIGSRFEPPTRTTVSIALNPTGQFVTTGSINGQPVRFLVDTGANIIAINSTKAATLGIAYSGGREMLAETAGGVVKSWTVALDLVQVGAIRMSNVDAAIIEGEYPQEILLGMTFLKNVEISERGGLMVLTSKF